MKLVRWKRFTWDLEKLAPSESALPGRYQVRAAQPQEQKVVSEVILSAYSSDPAWSDVFRDFRATLTAQIEMAFGREETPAAVICHGQRIIAASALTTLPDFEHHLLSGPCVVMEYRNRGLGTALLDFSLRLLRQAGLSQAHGISKHNVAAAKFIYPKFASSHCDYEYESALAGA
jgi:predicted N-acetyltransferase YhbS